MPVITFIEFDGTEHQVDADDGMSVMETAMKYNIPGIDADCGGSAVCGTCHCFVESAGQLPAIDPTEESMLGLRPDRAENSRLSCQLRVSDAMGDMVVRLPEFQM
jgi:2Fe-2S ferredoxin